MLGKRFFVCFALVAALLIGQMSFAAESDNGLTWDGKPATLKQIAENTGYDLADANGDYKPLYTFAAESLWEQGLFLGSNGSFDLDMPLTREQGVTMILRLLDKEQEALSQNLPCKFADVSSWAIPYVAYAVQYGITNGVSADRFDGSSAMTANQFCTFVLRVMGYQDNVDFTWDKAVDKALEIHLIGETCHAQYSHSNLFLRDNAVVIAYNALNGNIMKNGGNLLSSIRVPGKPQGSMPSATKSSATQTTKHTEPQKETNDKGAGVSFSNESFNIMRKANGAIDYVMLSVWLNFTAGESGKTMFRVEQSITPAYESLAQEKVDVYPSDSALMVGDDRIDGSTIVRSEVPMLTYGGINSIYTIKVYIDSTDTLVGKYTIELPKGGYFYFK